MKETAREIRPGYARPTKYITYSVDRIISSCLDLVPSQWWNRYGGVL